MPTSGFDHIARGVLDSLLEGCQVVDHGYRYTYLNDAAVAHARRGREELVGRTMAECYPGIEQTPMFGVLTRCMTERAHLRLENEFAYPDGSQGWFELRFIPVPDGVCILSLDVTPTKRAAAQLAESEERLRQAQKMDAIGRLAGGVAHDFNNLLSVILSHAQLMRLEVAEGEPLREGLDEIQRAGFRAADLTRQLLAFSRKQVLAPRVVDLSAALSEMERMLRRLLGASVDLTILRDPRPCTVRADPSQLEQVVLNLAVNARDAMPGGGKLTLEAKNVELDADYAAVHPEVTPGMHVMLAVTDTGTGMDRETQARIFEPFFTTKELGKGTGLGLATVFGIVKQSGGHIWLYSEPGMGTTFRVYLPREGALPEERTDAASSTPPPRGSETVLLVEDDEQVRAVAAAVLRTCGYHVLEAPNGGEALLVCEQHGAHIDLLLTDVVLPRMSGRQLAERLVPARPEMKVLYMSGYTDDAVIQHGVLEADVAYLQKPITPAPLARRVREVLDA